MKWSTWSTEIKLWNMKLSVCCQSANGHAAPSPDKTRLTHDLAISFISCTDTHTLCGAMFLLTMPDLRNWLRMMMLMIWHCIFFLLTYCQIFDFTHSICFKQLPVLITWNMYNDLCDAFELFSPNLQVQYPQTISRIQKVTCSPPPTYTHFLFSHPSFPAKPNLSVSFPLPLHKPYLSLYTTHFSCNTPLFWSTTTIWPKTLPSFANLIPPL